MTWTYEQSTGHLLRDGSVVGTGYSGAGNCQNDPGAQDLPNVGPIPRGFYTIGDPHDTPTHGPYVLRLTPFADNVMCGRAGFLIHGDNATHTASEGCIIMPRKVRKSVWESGDTELEVIA